MLNVDVLLHINYGCLMAGSLVGLGINQPFFISRKQFKTKEKL